MPIPPTKYFLVELDAFDGEFGTITPVRTPSFYCIGVLEGDVIRLIDWGYRSEAEARTAWRLE